MSDISADSHEAYHGHTDIRLLCCFCHKFRIVLMVQFYKIRRSVTFLKYLVKSLSGIPIEYRKPILIFQKAGDGSSHL